MVSDRLKPEKYRKLYFPWSPKNIKPHLVFIRILLTQQTWYQFYSNCGFHTLCCALSLSRVRLFAIPWTVARQAPLSLGILQPRILELVAMPSSRGSSRPKESNPGLPHCRPVVLPFIDLHLGTIFVQTHLETRGQGSPLIKVFQNKGEYILTISQKAFCNQF